MRKQLKIQSKLATECPLSQTCKGSNTTVFFHREGIKVILKQPKHKRPSEKDLV